MARILQRQEERTGPRVLKRAEVTSQEEPKDFNQASKSGLKQSYQMFSSVNDRLSKTIASLPEGDPKRMALEAQVVENEGITNLLEKQIPLTTRKGFLGAIKEDFTKREEQLRTSQEAFESGEQSRLSMELQRAGAGAGMLGDILLRGLSAITPDVIEQPIVGAVVGGIEKGAKTAIGQSIIQGITDWAEENPVAARNLESVINIAGLMPATKGAQVSVKTATQIVPRVAKTAITAGERAIITSENAIRGARALLNQRVTAKSIEQSIEAVSPKLKGKKLIEAYRQFRGERKMGGLGKQIIEPDQKTIELGERMAPILKSKDPLKNLKSIENAFSKTESELTGTLVKDTTPVIKRAVNDVLENVKTTTPREIVAIKDSKAIYDQVVDFASSVINKAEPNINGLRKARMAFDQQAKREFPSAFKESGFIDTKTPAGRAIKETRDAINEYMYDTAQEGSKLRDLIRMEADLFRATDNIAEKAVELHGKNAVGRFIQRHPNLKKVLWFGAAGGAGGVGAKFLLD